jgi:O-antigen/teichoic acid export membrane protein
MGIIRKQSIIGTIFTYIGVAIGFVTTAILFPEYLTTAQIGLLGLLLSYAMIFAQISSLGFMSATTRFFTFFRDKEKKHHGFVFLLFTVTTAGFGLALIVFYILRPFLIENSVEKSALFIDYIDYIIPLTLFTAFFNALDHYYKVLYNAVIGIVLKEFVQRVLILAAMILFVYAAVSFRQFVNLYTLCFLAPALIILFYLLKAGEISFRTDFSFLHKDLVASMAGVSLFGVISGATGIFTLNIDRIMIDRMMGLGPTGVYTTAYFFGVLVMMPSRSVTKISSAIIADAWKNKDFTLMLNLYCKSSLNQLIVGLLLLIGMWGNIDNIFRILPPEFAEGRWVILAVGLGYLTDMVIGVSYMIVTNSSSYKYGTYYLLLMVALIVIFNLVLIPSLGITGAALAFVLTKVIVNFLLIYFVIARFRMMPFNYKFLLVLLFGGAAYLASWFIPLMDNLYIDILIRSTVITAVFMGPVILFRISEDINERLVYYLKRFAGINVRL